MHPLQNELLLPYQTNPSEGSWSRRPTAHLDLWRVTSTLCIAPTMLGLLWLQVQDRVFSYGFVWLRLAALFWVAFRFWRFSLYVFCVNLEFFDHWWPRLLHRPVFELDRQLQEKRSASPTDKTWTLSGSALVYELTRIYAGKSILTMG